jgi:hypothetical protein
MAAFRGRESHVPGLFRAELHQHPEMFDLFLNPAVTSIIQSLLGGAEAIRLFPNYSVRPKLPETRQHNVAWHQDCGLNPGAPTLAVHASAVPGRCAPLSLVRSMQMAQ